MALKTLIIHEFRVIRKIVENYIVTEHNEAVIDLSKAPDDTIKLINTKKYDVVLCGLEMSEMDGFAVHELIRSSDINHETPLIIMTSTDSKSQYQRLLNKGIRYKLTIPFSPIELRDLIYEVCNPRKLRSYTRHSIPKARVVIDTEGQSINADVINISMNGILCEFINSEFPGNLISPFLINIKFPDHYSCEDAENIKAVLLRLSIEERDENNSAQSMRTAWKFIELPDQAEKILKIALKKAQSELLAAENAAKR
ncbi:Response regulator [Candidatus Magnetomoraceae bacterium gMMP-15]